MKSHYLSPERSHRSCEPLHSILLRDFWEALVKGVSRFTRGGNELSAVSRTLQTYEISY